MGRRVIGDRARIAGALALLVVLAYAAPLVGGATFVGRDHLTHTLPAKQVIADSVRAGHIPEWWPAVDLGVPFAANPNHSALYPPVWLVAVLPMPWAADVVLVLHVLLGALGMAALSRRLGATAGGAIVGGGIFALAGFVPSTVVHGGPLLTLAWLPWTAWATDRLVDRHSASLRDAARSGQAGPCDQHSASLRDAARSGQAGPRDRSDKLGPVLALAAIVAATLLAGDPSFALLGALLSAGVVACRSPHRVRDLALAVVAHVVAAALAAVVLLPAAYLAADSARAGGVAHDAATAWSMHPLRLIELVWPDVLGNPNHEASYAARAVADASGPLHVSPGWALSVFVSLPAIALAWIGARTTVDRRIRSLAWLALGFALLALGRYTPVYDLYRMVFVPERFVRYPEKYLAGALVIACALAARGWSELDGMSRGTRRGVVAILVAGVAAVAAVLLLVPAHVDGSTLAPTLDINAAMAHARTNALVALAVAIAVLALAARARTRPFAAAVLLLHLVSRTWSILPTFDRDVLAHPPKIIAGVAAGTRIARPTEHRVRPDDPLPAQARTLYEGAVANVATRFGIRYFIGYDQGHSGELERWARPLQLAGERALARFGVELEVVPADDVADRQVLASDAPYGPYALVRTRDARPRAFVTERWISGTEDEARHLLLDTSDAPDVVDGHGEPHEGSSKLVPCNVIERSAEALDVTCDAPGEALAVLLDAYARGWSATVDGASASIERVDGVVRGVRIGAGHHVIAYRYVTPGLRAGAMVSLIAWLVLLGLLLRQRGTRR